MENLKVSICCISFNHGAFIRECLEGFLNQTTNFDFEILIHDDASTDGTKEIIKEYATKYPELFKPILQTENQWSKGIKNIQSKYNFPRAKGKYIAICEGDDYWSDPLKLQKQVDFLEANLDFNISFHRAVRITPEGKELDEFPSLDLKENLTIEDLARNNFIPNLSVMFRNRQLDYSIGKNLPLGDYAMHLINAKNGKIHYHKEVMAAYRVNVGVFSTESKATQRMNSVVTINKLIETRGFSDSVIRNLSTHRDHLLFYIFKDKAKLKPKEEWGKMLKGEDYYQPLSFFQRTKYMLKSIITR